MSNILESRGTVGKLALEYCNVRLPIQVMQSRAGFYIGTAGEFGPCSRESVEYFPSDTLADTALKTGAWTQKEHP